MGYKTVSEAEAAIQKFDGLDLGQGVRLKVALALAKQKPTFTDLEETEPTVNGITSNDMPHNAEEGSSVRYDDGPLIDVQCIENTIRFDCDLGV